MKYKSSLERIRGRVTAFQKERDRLERKLRVEKLAVKEKKREEVTRSLIGGSSSVYEDMNEDLNFACSKNSTLEEARKKLLFSGNQDRGSMLTRTKAYQYGGIFNDDSGDIGTVTAEKSRELEQYSSSSGTSSVSEENVEETIIQLSDSEKDVHEMTPPDIVISKVIPTPSSQLENKENIVGFERMTVDNISRKTFRFSQGRLPLSRESVRELKDNPLLMFSGYRYDWNY